LPVGLRHRDKFSFTSWTGKAKEQALNAATAM
jgi:hypothetical protein